MKIDKKVVAIHYVIGFAICAVSLFLRFLWLEGSTVPAIVRNIIGGLPWISVAVVIVLWRTKEHTKAYPLAYIGGTATAFAVTALWLMIR